MRGNRLNTRNVRYEKRELSTDKPKNLLLLAAGKDTPPVEHDSCKLEVLGGY